MTLAALDALPASSEPDSCMPFVAAPVAACESVAVADESLVVILQELAHHAQHHLRLLREHVDETHDLWFACDQDRDNIPVFDGTFFVEMD